MRIITLFSRSEACPGTGTFPRALVLALAIALTGASGLRAAEDAAAQKLLAEARAKEMHAQELRTAAATTLQKAADDQIEAGVEEREARILAARALKLLGADAKKQRAFNLRNEARKLLLDAHGKVIEGRNAEQRAAQLTHDADELRKTAAQLKDQPTIASTLENEAKAQATQAQSDEQIANQDKAAAQVLEERGKAAWMEAEKLDPETQRQLAPISPKPPVAAPRQVK
jgi:uncharacterized phage infection (PIP) family protein YhgE